MANEILSPKVTRSRRALLDAAYALFVSQGYAATSMRQVAEAAGLALGSIYNHFSSKEELFEIILVERHPYHQIIPFLQDAPGVTVDEFIHNAASRLVAELGMHPEFINLMLIELVEFKGKHAPILFETIFPDVSIIIERMAAFQLDLRPIPLSMLMRAFLGMFFSYCLTDLLLNGLMPADMQENSLDGFVDIFLHGIKQSPRALTKPEA